MTSGYFATISIPVGLALLFVLSQNGPGAGGRYMAVPIGALRLFGRPSCVRLWRQEPAPERMPALTTFAGGYDTKTAFWALTALDRVRGSSPGCHNHSIAIPEFG